MKSVTASTFSPSVCLEVMGLDAMILVFFYNIESSLMVQIVKNSPTIQETWVQSLGQEDPLEKGMMAHSSVLAYRIPWAEKPGRLQSKESQRIRHD